MGILGLARSDRELGMVKPSRHAWRLPVAVLMLLATGASQAQRLPSLDDAVSPLPRSERDANSADTTAPPAVAMVYVVPSDRRPIPAFERVLQNAIVELQHWYGDQMGGRKSFALADPVVRTVRTEHPSAWYAATPNGASWQEQFFGNVIAEGFKQTGGGYRSRQVVTVTYIDAEMAEGQHGGAGSDGAAVLHRMDIEGLLGRRKEPVCRWVGGLGHELGHAFGRPHPPECEGPDATPNAPACQTLMYQGMYAFPKTAVLDVDRMAFDRSPFFTAIAFPGRAFDCTVINTIAAQAPGTRACDLKAVGARTPDHVCYAGHNGGTALSGLFARVAGNRWRETNEQASLDWISTSESPRQIALFDRSRNLNFEIDLERNRMRWRVGTAGRWTEPYEVTGHD